MLEGQNAFTYNRLIMVNIYVYFTLFMYKKKKRNYLRLVHEGNNQKNLFLLVINLNTYFNKF